MIQKTLITLTLIACAQTALAAKVAPACFISAAHFAEKNAVDNGYDENGFEAYTCAVAPNNKAIICDVAASKGEGAAMDTYRVVMNTSCSKAYRVELTGEE